MKLTRRVIEGFLACKYKGYLLISGRSGTPHDLEILRAEAQIAYGEQATAALLRKYRKSSAGPTVDEGSHDLRSGSEIILRPTLEDDETAFEFDALRRLEGDSTLGPFHYGPVLFWHRDKLTTQQTRLIAAGGLILARHQGIQAKTGTIVCGANCTIRTIKLTTHYRAVQQFVDGALALASGISTPPLRLNDHCGLCEFRDECRRQAIESDDLSILGRVTEKQISAYRQKGILTVTHLSYTFRARRGKLTHPKCRPRSLPLHALAIRQQRILVVGKPTFPTADVRIYFDAEGDPERKFHYLLGLLIVKDGQEQMFSLWADDPSQQTRLFNQFMDIVGQYPSYVLFHYGTYESALLRQMRTVVRNKRAVDAVMAATVNVLAPLFSDVYFPTYSNGLKDVAKYLGFSWTDANASGLQSLAWRARWEFTGDDTFKQKLTTYNSEDCRALKLVTEALSSIGQREQVAKNGSGIKVEEVSFEPNSRTWGEIDYVLPDLDYINKCAYFDYQHDKVYIRGSEAKPRRKRRPRNTKKRWLRPTVRTKIRMLKCPTCGGHSLESMEGKVFKKQAFDLVMRQSGVIREVIEYSAVRTKCAQCSRVSLPNKYLRIDAYRHGLKSWVMYQHIEHLVSLTRLVAMCDEFFHIPLQLNYVCMIKAIMAARYRPTARLLMQRLLAGPVIYVDETQIALRHGKGYVWVLANSEEVIYLYRPNREAGFLKELLAGFQGVVVSDFFSGYDGLQCLQQKCLVHLIRDMNADLRLNPFDDELKALIGRFASLLRKIVETIDSHGLSKQWLSKQKPQADAFLDSVCSTEYCSKVAQGYKERFAKYRDRLFVFLERDGVSWNNNYAEHAIKYFAHYRMLADGTVVEGALKDYLTLLSICVTCKHKRLSFLRFLLSRERDIDAFRQLGKTGGHVRRMELYPKGFPNRDRKPIVRSRKGNEDIAEKNGVGEIYRKTLSGIEGYCTSAQLSTTGTCLVAIMGKKQRSLTLMSLVPKDSNSESGLRYTMYVDRLAEYLGIGRASIRAALPDNLEPEQRAGRFKGCCGGYFQRLEEVDKFLGVISSQSKRESRLRRHRSGFRVKQAGRHDTNESGGRSVSQGEEITRQIEGGATQSCSERQG